MGRELRNEMKPHPSVSRPTSLTVVVIVILAALFGALGLLALSCRSAEISQVGYDAGTTRGPVPVVAPITPGADLRFDFTDDPARATDWPTICLAAVFLAAPILGLCFIAWICICGLTPWQPTKIQRLGIHTPLFNPPSISPAA